MTDTDTICISTERFVRMRTMERKAYALLSALKDMDSMSKEGICRFLGADPQHLEAYDGML